MGLITLVRLLNNGVVSSNLDYTVLCLVEVKVVTPRVKECLSEAVVLKKTVDNCIKKVNMLNNGISICQSWWWKQQYWRSSGISNW